MTSSHYGCIQRLWLQVTELNWLKEKNMHGVKWKDPWISVVPGLSGLQTLFLSNVWLCVLGIDLAVPVIS